jgi:uncharacterized protein
MKKWIILIPPSEGKIEDGDSDCLNEFDEVTEKLLKDLDSYSGDLGKLYGVKDKKLQEVKKINSRIRGSKTLPAIERYSGVVYNGIDYPSIINKDLFNQRVYILSGLFGLINCKKLIPNYKFKINFFDASKLWSEKIKEFLKDYYVIDLLPLVHRKAVSYEEGIFVEFVVVMDGERKSAGHEGKLVKGKFVRWLIEKNVESVDRFNEFNEEGYRWDGERFVKKYD